MKSADPDDVQVNGRVDPGQAMAGTRRFFLLVYRLGADVFKRFPADMLKVVLASGIGLCCQLLALVILYAYLNALESDQPLYGYQARVSAVMFVMVALANGLLFFGYAVLEYKANIRILALCQSYQKTGAAEIISLSSKLPHWFEPGQIGGISARHLRQMVTVDIRHRSRMARVLMRAIIPALRLVFSAAAIVYINLEFSLLILLIIGFPMAGLYWVGKRVADTITSRETAAQSPYQEQLGLLTKNWADETHILTADIESDPVLGQEDSRQGQYFTRLRAKTLGQFLINTANTLGILALILSLGYWMLQEPQDNWSLWLTYLIALRYFLSSLSRVAQAIIQSTRFSRQVGRVMDFVAAAVSATAVGNLPLPPCPEHLLAAYRGNSRDIVDDDDDFEDD